MVSSLSAFFMGKYRCSFGICKAYQDPRAEEVCKEQSAAITSSCLGLLASAWALRFVRRSKVRKLLMFFFIHSYKKPCSTELK